MAEHVQRAISIPEPINEVDSLWITSKALKEAVETMQGIRGNRELALQQDLLSQIDDLQVQIETIGVFISGGVSYDIIAAETTANATVTDKSYLPGDIRRYGALVATADNTTAIQDAINVAGHGRVRFYVPGESGARYRFAATLFFYFDATNNPNFPSGVRQDGRTTNEGDGMMSSLNFQNDDYLGSTLEYTGATGPGYDFYDSGGTESKGITVRYLNLLGTATSDPLVQVHRIPRLSFFHDLFIGNKGSGEQISIQDVWVSSFKRIWLYGNGTSAGLLFDPTESAGMTLFEMITSENNAIGFDLGAAYSAGRTAWAVNNIFKQCQSTGNASAFRVRAGMGSALFDDCFIESINGSGGRGFEINNMAGWLDANYVNHGLIEIRGGNINWSDVVNGPIGIEIGDDTGTNTTDGAGNVIVDKVIFGQITANSDAIRIHNVPDDISPPRRNAGYRIIRDPVFHNNGGQYIVIDAEAQFGPLFVYNVESDGVTEPNIVEDTAFANASQWIAGSDNLVPLFNANTTYDLGDASRIPSQFSVTTAGGATTITLPLAPTEQTALMTKLSGGSLLTLERNGENINGVAVDFTTTLIFRMYVISWVRNFGWTIKGIGDLDPDSVTNDLLAEMANNTVKVNATSGIANPTDVNIPLNTVLGRRAGDIVAAPLLGAQVLNGTISLNKILDMATNTFLGRDTGGTGQPEVITMTAARTMLNVEDGATDDQTAAEIEAIVNHDNLLGFLSAEHIDWALASQGTIHATNYVDNDTVYTHPNHSGDVTSVGDGAQTIVADAVTNAKLANMAARTVKLNATASSVNPTDLAVGVNTVLGRVAGNIVATALVGAQVVNGTITLNKMLDIATDTFLGRDTGGTGQPEVITMTAARTMLNVEDNAAADQTAGEIEAIVDHDNLLGFLGAEHVDWAAAGAENLATDRSANAVLALTSGEVTQLANIGATTISTADWTAVAALLGVNTGDQTSIVGITGTQAQFDTAVTDGNISYIGHLHDSIVDTNLLDKTADELIPGDYTYSGKFIRTGQTVLNTQITAALTGDVNDYNPTGFSTCTVLKLTADAARTITGLVTTTSNRLIYLINLDTTDIITLAHNSGSSAAANRIMCPNDAAYAVPPRGMVTLVHADNKWHVGGV